MVGIEGCNTYREISSAALTASCGLDGKAPVPFGQDRFVTDRAEGSRPAWYKKKNSSIARP